MIGLGLACEPRISVDLGRLTAIFVFRCACVLVTDMLTGERVQLAVNCLPHVALCAFADSEG